MMRATVGFARAGRAQRWASSTAVAKPVKEIKFQKESVAAVMKELPEFKFYEMNESEPYPYHQTLDRSILIDPPASKPLPKPTVEFAKLENGLRVAAVDRGGLKASVGLFVSAGSRHESPANFGASHMVSEMAYKSTAHLSNLRTVKTLEQLGANNATTCTAGREEISYQVEVMREYVPLVVPLLVGNILFPRLLPWEVKATHGNVKKAQTSLAANPSAMVKELLHKAAYCNNTLGLSPLASDRSMPYFTPETIRSFMLDNFAPERMVLVGVNVAPDELNKWAMRSFVDYNAIPMKERPDAKATYTGGEMRMDGPSPFCHVAVGLASSGMKSSDLAAAAVLQAHLGADAFLNSYSDSGLIGIYRAVPADQAAEATAAINQALMAMKSITADQLAHAKSVLKGKLLRQMDDDAQLMQDIGHQLIASGAYRTPDEFAQLVDRVTVEEATAVAESLLSSAPSVAAYGDVHGVPPYSAINSFFKAAPSAGKKATETKAAEEKAKAALAAQEAAEKKAAEEKAALAAQEAAEKKAAEEEAARVLKAEKLAQEAAEKKAAEEKAVQVAAEKIAREAAEKKAAEEEAARVLKAEKLAQEAAEKKAAEVKAKEKAAEKKSAEEKAKENSE